MAVEQNMRRALRPVMVRHDHGMTGGIAKACVKTQFIKGVHQPLACRRAAILVGRVRRHGFDLQQREQPLKGCVEIVVNG